MATPPKQGEELTEAEDQASTPHLDRLEKLAKAAETSAQDRQWRARKNGLRTQEEEPSEVRNLTHDEAARAQAEAAMQKMMAKPSTKKPSRW